MQYQLHEAEDIFANPRTPYAVSICVRCRGTKMLCGKPVCPILVKYYADSSVRKLTSQTEMDGMSPPGVFIGRFGYPKVDIGPFITPVTENVSILDTPERWVGKKLEDITQMRFSLIRGKHSIRIDRPEGDKIYTMVQEISMAGSSPSMEVKFRKEPKVVIALDDDIQPFGRSGRIERIESESGRFDSRIEKAFYDTDLPAGEGVVSLYNSNVMVSGIQRAFSAGVLGVGKNRKMVPTRWSITAVDDLIGKHLVAENKQNDLLWNFRVYSYTALDNRWVIILLPSSWRYELIEAWYPNTTWNPSGRQIWMISSHEFYGGRREYAEEIGGCYYAARLAVNELLRKERIQAGAVILREAHPGYIMPVGVWNVREHVRETLRSTPSSFDTLDASLQYASGILEIPVNDWLAHSEVLRNFREQRRLDQF
ncbi:MAG: hypothetical protein KHF84_05700 [Thermoplasmata archaeon]|nr:hypothetical protein [Candidatus Sysuiplasma jiujiangense]